MILAAIEVACCIPLAITTMVLNATRGEVRPWISWEDTHYGMQSFSFFSFLEDPLKLIIYQDFLVLTNSPPSSGSRTQMRTRELKCPAG